MHVNKRGYGWLNYGSNQGLKLFSNCILGFFIHHIKDKDIFTTIELNGDDSRYIRHPSSLYSETIWTNKALIYRTIRILSGVKIDRRFTSPSYSPGFHCKQTIPFRNICLHIWNHWKVTVFRLFPRLVCHDDRLLKRILQTTFGLGWMTMMATSHYPGQ